MTTRRQVLQFSGAAVIGAAAGIASPIGDPAAAAAVPNSADIGFCTDMTTHHLQALVMCQRVLGRDTGGSVQAAAAEVLQTQSIEVGMMRAWLTDWGESTTAPDTVMAWMGMNLGAGIPAESMMGLATDAEMRALSTAEGLARGRLWLELMRAHHVGGVHMATAAIELVDTKKVRRLARTQAEVQAFEIEGLVGTAAAPAVLSYLFHRIGDRLDGRPTLLIIDEGWLALDDEGFAGQLREWLKTLRKKNASVIFATQSLSDIDTSAIAPAIIESCPTRLLLPNERAIEPQITAIYRRFGLNDRQIEILARATPKRDYYCQSRRGNRLFSLGLGEVGDLVLARRSERTDALAQAGRDRPDRRPR